MKQLLNGSSVKGGMDCRWFDILFFSLKLTLLLLLHGLRRLNECMYVRSQTPTCSFILLAFDAEPNYFGRIPRQICYLFTNVPKSNKTHLENCRNNTTYANGCV